MLNPNVTTRTAECPADCGTDRGIAVFGHARACAHYVAPPAQVIPAKTKKPRARHFNADDSRACYVCNGTVRAGTGHHWTHADGSKTCAHDKCYQADCD